MPRTWRAVWRRLCIFCLLSSGVYLINDLADVEKDRQHPTKRNRPIASGALAPQPLSWRRLCWWPCHWAAPLHWARPFGLVSLAYLLLMIAYSFYLKNLVILDVMAIAAGFVLRVFAGAAAVQVTRFSPWLYVCTTLLALFIAINKRRDELLLLAERPTTIAASLRRV